MKQERSTPVAVERPSQTAIARTLAEMAGAMSDFDGDAGSFERHQMQIAAKHLACDPPKAAKALKCAESGVAHAWRGTWQESRAEAWICAAVAELLKPARPIAERPLTVKLPTADEIGNWVDLLGTVAEELYGNASPGPAPGTDAAAMRMLQLQLMRLWLVGALHIRIGTDAGKAAGGDPDALPTGDPVA